MEPFVCREVAWIELTAKVTLMVSIQSKTHGLIKNINLPMAIAFGKDDRERGEKTWR